MATLQKGTSVQWESPPGGMTLKRGKIVRVLRKDETPINVAKSEFPDHMRMFDGLNLPFGADIAYLVEVSAGPRAKLRLYLPRPSMLKAE